MVQKYLLKYVVTTICLMLTLLWRHSLAKPNHDEDDEEDDDGAAHQGDQSDHYFHTDINL